MKHSVRNLSFIMAFAAMAIFACSCVTPEKVLYLQDMDQNSQIEIENKYEAKVSPNDEIRVIISCHDEELSKPFNLGYGTGGNGMYNGMGEGGRYMGYLVDVNGNIQLPILGQLHVAGKTRLQIQDEVRQMLIKGQYIEDPYVMVRFNNYKIFFLGPDGGKSITIPEERCTFLEALALAGDLSPYTMRDKIAVLREVDGHMTMRYLDPRDSKVFNDPYYMLQQNDMIITRSISSTYYKESFSYWASWVSLIASFASIATAIIVLAK